MATANLLQTSVSGGTQNALSLQGDGVFFPKASTTSRLALTLTTTDKGFIVYDTTDNNIYFWNGTAWESIPGSGDAGANGSVQYNDNGIVSGATNFVYDKATGNVGIGGAPISGFRLNVNNGDFRVSDVQNEDGVELGWSLGGSHGFVQAYNRTTSAFKDLVLNAAVTINSIGNVGIGVVPGAWRTSVPFKALQVGYTGAVYGITTSEQVNLSSNYLQDTGGNEVRIQAGFATRYQQASGQHLWSTAASSTAGSGITFTQAMTLDASGNLLVGVASGTFHRILKGAATGAPIMDWVNFGSNGAVAVCTVDRQTYSAANAAACALRVGDCTGGSRSINASGSINANGADYAEYMTKAGDFTIEKGDVAGIDSNGMLTNVFADAISFVVKSTDPSYVGNDNWGTGIEGAEFEAARELVDRIAFAGQVPVNVIGATAGDYIVPVVNGTAIKGIAVSNPTFEQYKIAVGKVITIDTDGRARIIVKVA